MAWSKKTALVCFHPHFSNRDAAQHLAPAKGFRRIKHIYELTNWVMVEVHAGQLDIFLDNASQLDEVQECEYNYILTPSTVNEHVGSWSPASEWSCDRARILHKTTLNPSDGLGIKIALADTGLSAHPYLPALSFRQSLAYLDQWPDALAGVSINKLSDIAYLEDTAPFPLTATVTDPEQSRFIQEAEYLFNQFTGDLRYQWETSAKQWLNDNLPGARRFRLGGVATGISPMPPLPLNQKNIYGPLRRISLRSRNFVHDDLCVFDNEGHGTQMAGIIAGRPGMSLGESDPSRIRRLQQYEADIFGLAPYAELLILKCWDSESDDDSNVGNLVRALEYANEQAADLIYCGLSVNPFFGQTAGIPPTASSSPSTLHYRTLRLLEETLFHLNQLDVPVICPAGNDGAIGLSAPGMFQGALCVTASWDSNGQITLAQYSNRARPGEEVSFTAYGGETLSDGLITADLNFGFTRVAGTSVSAAIITGILARFLARKNTAIRSDEYEDRMLQSLGGGRLPPPYPAPFFTYQQRIPINQLISEALKSTAKCGSSSPSPEFGYGLLRDIP